MATIRKHRNRWQVQIRRAGHRPFSKSFFLRKDALEWARQSELAADRAELPHDPKALRQVRLGELVQRYIDTISVRKRGHEIERIVLRKFLSHEICSRRLSELRTDDFARYRDQRLEVIKPASLRRQLNPIRHLFEVARDEWGLPIKENPLHRLKISVLPHSRERRLQSGEFERLIAAANLCRNPFVADLIRLALATGMRRGELLAIKHEHFNWKERALLIPTTKNGHARTIPLSQEAISVFRKYRGSEPQFFPVTANAFRLAWERVRKRAGVADLHFHDLRHEAISRLFEKGLTPPEVALVSGHRDARMLMRYSHATRKRIIQVLDASDSSS